MMRDMYQFNRDDAYMFAHTTGIRTKNKGNELMFDVCPYCNGGRNRDRGTFSISLVNGQFSCQRASCNAKGNMITLARDFGIELTKDVAAYYNINNYNGKFRSFRQKHIEIRDAAVEYLKTRGISEKVAKLYEITVKPEQEHILVFPFRDENQELVFVKYRNINFQKGEGNKEWCEANCKPILFGMAQCNLDNKTLIITEGQIDSLSVTEAGYENAISVPTGKNGFTWVSHCWNWIHQFNKIIVFGDFENGNMTLLDEISKRFSKSIEIFHVRYEDYLDCKDANEILLNHGKEAVQHCIDNAIHIPVNRILQLADVEDVNIFEIPKLATGIAQLDKCLYGGLPFGGVTLIAGKPGEGKSTVASQIAINAIEQGHKVFAYSGELPAHMFESWMSLQVAGPQNLMSYQDSVWGEQHYKIPSATQSKISNWYRNRMYLFDNRSIEGDEQEDLLKTVEQSIRQYETDVILIDNLMTALDLESIAASDKYEKQSKFVKGLTRIALEYNVLILLVAHKRKNNFNTNENDEISGSGDIANLAMITLTYEREKEVKEDKKRLKDDQRFLKLSKNRLFGRTYTEGWILNFEQSSKRIYGIGDNLQAEYSWNDSPAFVQVETELDIPF